MLKSADFGCFQTENKNYQVYTNLVVFKMQDFI